MPIEIGLPGLVFLALCIWLVRRALRAARTERDLEDHRFEGAFAEELAKARALAAAQAAAPEARLASVPPLDADLSGTLPGHAEVVAALVEPGARVSWIRSIPGHVVWCERRKEGEVLRVVKIDGAGHPGEQWTFLPPCPRP